jgi:predicted MFS family arabinose efflux permease
VIWRSLSLALFVVIELSTERPLLDLGIFKSFNFTISAVLIALLSNGLFSGQYFVPLFLQQGDGLGAFQTGLTLVPPVIVLIFLMPVSGELFDRLGARWLGAIGLLIIAVATYLMHGISQEVSRGQVMMWLALQYLGVGLAFIPIQTGSMSRLSPDELSGGSAINNIVQRVSGALGTAVLGALLTGYQAQRLAGQADLLPAVAPGFAQLQAFADQGQAGVLFLLNGVQLIGFGRALGDVFLLTAALTAIGVLLALLLPKKLARSAGGRVTVALE